MREILFRGKTKDGKWVCGNLTQYTSKLLYIDSFAECESGFAIPKTIGQYTGLTDKNGQKIFEGDVVKGLFLHSVPPINSVIDFRDGCFGLLWYRGEVETFWAFSSICNVEYEVIGNIHDNPELMKGGGG